MKTRRLGRTGLQVSELCFGTDALARIAGDRSAGLAALAKALALGVTAIEIDGGDLALAEQVGAVLRREGAQHRVHVLARVRSPVPFDLPSPHIHADRAYAGALIRAQTEALLRALGVERLAVQQLHAWCAEWLKEGTWRATLERLRAESKIAGIGISLFDHDVTAAQGAIASGAVDCVQTMFNIFDPAAIGLFAACAQHDIGVIARSPLYFGALADTQPRAFPPEDWRHNYFYPAHAQEAAARAARIAAEVAGPLATTALRYALSPAIVATVAVGMRTPAQVEANVGAAAQGPLPADRLSALAAHRWLC